MTQTWITFLIIYVVISFTECYTNYLLLLLDLKRFLASISYELFHLGHMMYGLHDMCWNMTGVNPLPVYSREIKGMWSVGEDCCRNLWIESNSSFFIIILQFLTCFKNISWCWYKLFCEMKHSFQIKIVQSLTKISQCIFFFSQLQHSFQSKANCSAICWIAFIGIVFYLCLSLDRHLDNLWWKISLWISNIFHWNVNLFDAWVPLGVLFKMCYYVHFDSIHFKHTRLCHMIHVMPSIPECPLEEATYFEFNHSIILIKHHVVL